MALSIDAVASNNLPHDAAPDSPPELVHSSSKSSSLRSSSLADATATPSDISNFEDISLDEVYSLSSFPSELFAKPLRMPLDKRPPPLMPGARPRPGPEPGLRVLTNAGRPVRPNGASPLYGAHVASQNPRRRVSPSPSTFLPLANPRTGRSRSVSPTSTSPRTAPIRPSSPRYTPSQATFRPIPGSARRASSSSKKSIQELEDEYHDSDEELPEDAVIWNVPISPRPNTERATSSPRKHQSTPLPLTPKYNLPHRNSAPVGSMDMKSGPSAMGIRSLPRNMTFDQGDARMARNATKSWDAAMSDLCDEAQELTQALEQLTEETEKQQEEDVQQGGLRKHSYNRSFSSSAIELPPVRKGDVMIDPLPCSKEKEKVLTRTRPSWLPPKNPKEEKKHLRQYQEMMARSLETEQKRAQKVQDEQCRRDTTQKSMARIWEQHILPNWDTAIIEPRTRELWWRGVSPRDRGTVWQKAVGNELGISEQTYTAASDRARAAEKRLARLDLDQRQQEHEWHWFEAIRRDVDEAFPELKIFQAQGPLHQSLVDVLRAYALYRPDVGYVHGVHGIAALLLLNLSAPAVFTTLANLLNRPIPAAMLAGQPAALDKVRALVLDAFGYKYPALHIHLTSPNLAISPATYVDPMLRSLFCAPQFGPDVASRVMDVYVFEGDKMLVRAAVGTLARLEARLYGNPREVLDVLDFRRTHKWELGSEDDFIAAAREAGKVDHEDEKGRLSAA